MGGRALLRQAPGSRDYLAPLLELSAGSVGALLISGEGDVLLEATQVRRVRSSRVCACVTASRG